MIQALETTTILIIDDMPSNLGVVVHMLEDKGHRVVIAQEGDEALQRADLVRPDLILLDVMMPGADGFEVCRRLKRQESTCHIPVIFMTALASSDHKIKGFEVGGVDYITKPLQLDEVLVRIGTHLQLHAAKRRLEQQNRQLEVYQQELEKRVLERTAELSAVNRQLSTLIDNIPDFVVRLDRQGRHLFVSPNVLHAFGVPAEHFLGKTVVEIGVTGNGEDDRRLLDAALRCVRERKPNHIEMTFRSGRLHRVNSIVHVPEFNEFGEVSTVLEVVRDITERCQLEQELARREIEFRTLAENSPDMIVRYDLDGRPVYMNPAYEYETGMSTAISPLTTPCEALGPAALDTEFMVCLRRVMETGRPERIPIERKDSNGVLVNHEFHAVAEYGEDGKVAGALVIGRNVTELKDTERRIKDSQAQLRTLAAKREEAREDERKRIAREIHDELGQLLSVLRLNVMTLDYRFGDVNPDLRGRAQKMVGTVDRAIQMVRNLATRLRPAVLNAGILPAVEWLVQEYSENTGIVGELFVSGEGVCLDEDRAMLVFRIVQESLTNVLRHAHASRVDVVINSANGVCEVEVRDNGKGLDPETIKANSYGILGMRERALILKGELEIAAMEEGGTLLRLRIPLNEHENTVVEQG